MEILVHRHQERQGLSWQRCQWALLPAASSPACSIISCLHLLLPAASLGCSIISCLQHLLASITFACLLPRVFSQVPSQSSFLGKLVHLKGEMRPLETFSFFYYSSDQFQRRGLGGNLVEFIILLYQQTATQTVSSWLCTAVSKAETKINCQ